MDERDARRVLAADLRHVWHPFTQMAEWSDPLVIEAAEGCELIDIHGNRYLDGVSSLWVNVHGHRRREIDAAVRQQLDKVAHSTLLGLSNVPSALLAERLVSMVPGGLTRVFYSDSGSTAVEVALKMAFQHRGRRRLFVHLGESYHGDTLGAVSVGGVDLFHGIFAPLLFETAAAPSSHCYRCPLSLRRDTCAMACAAEMERLVENRHDEIAAVIMEPRVQGAAGMIVHPEGYLRRVSEVCRAFSVPLILDEVATGFGRTGAMFACELEGVTPDIMCLAKGLTGGYLPLAATLATEAVYESFLGEFGSMRTLYHGHTYTGNPLACAAALASLDLFESERTLDRVRSLDRGMEPLLAPIRSQPHVGDVRSIGLMMGVELVRDRVTKEQYPYGEKWGYRVTDLCRRRSVILRPLGNVVVVMPPLAVSDAQLRRILEVLHDAIDEVTR